jgi:glycosyltransferase involved in cell wall biosynthesis/O-antigen ligase
MRANSWLNQFSFYLFCLFPLLIALPPKGMLAVAFVVLQAAVIVTRKLNFSIRGIWFPILQGLPTLFFALSLLYSDDAFTGNKYLETSMMVFFLPWVLYANRASITTQVLEKTMRFYAGVVAVFIIYLLSVFVLSGEFIAAIKAPDAYFQIRTYLEVVSGMHPTYFSLLLGIAILAAQAELKRTDTTKWHRLFALACISIIAVGLLLASSKMILTATFIGSAIIWGEKWRFKTVLLRVSTAALLLLVIVLLVKPMRQRANDFVNALTQSEVNPHNPDSMRKAIYQSTFAVIAENFWLGTGIGDQQHALDEKYQLYGYELAEERQFNTHNNYLQVWLAAGFVPFLFFVLLVVSQIAIAAVNRNYLHLGIVVLFGLSFLTENILSRQDGVFMYAFFSSFLVFATWSKNEKLICINGRFTSQNATGVQRFATEMTFYLQQKSANYTLLVPRKLDAFANNSKAITIFKGTLWEQFSLPIYMRLLGSPRLINFGNSAPVFYRNQFVTLHDVAFLENPNWFSAKFVRWYAFMIPKIVKKSRHVFTVSEFSKTEIVKHFKTNPDKITVVYNGLPRFIDFKENTNPTVEGKYALCVGSITARKNQEQLVDCFLKWEDSPVKLVLAGSFDEAVFGNNLQLKSKLKEAKNIILIDNPSDEVLSNLYQHALFALYLPFYEGFGLPVLESLAYKKPIIVSDIPVFRELFSDLVLFSTLNNNGNLRGTIKEMLESLEFWHLKLENTADLHTRFSYKKSAILVDKTVQDQG